MARLTPLSWPLLLLLSSSGVQAFAPHHHHHHHQAQRRCSFNTDATTTTTTALFYDKHTGAGWDETSVIDRKPYSGGSGGSFGATSGAGWDALGVIDRRLYTAASGGATAAASVAAAADDSLSWYNPQDYLLEPPVTSTASSSSSSPAESHEHHHRPIASYNNNNDSNSLSWYNPEDYLLEPATTTTATSKATTTSTPQISPFARKNSQTMTTPRHHYQHYNNDNDDYRTFNPVKYPEMHEDRVVAAGVGTGVLAALVAGPIGGIMAGFTAAYVAEHEHDNNSVVVKSVRAVGEVALRAKYIGAELDRQQHLVGKTLMVAEDIWEKAMELDREHHFVEKAKNVAIYSTEATVDFVKRHHVLERGIQGIGAIFQSLSSSAATASAGEVGPRDAYNSRQRHQRHVVSYEPSFSPDRMAYSSASSRTRSTHVPPSQPPRGVWPNQTPSNPRQQQQQQHSTAATSSSSQQGSLSRRPTNPSPKGEHEIVKFSAFAKKNKNQPTQQTSQPRF